MRLGFLRPRGAFLSSGTVCPFLACCPDAKHAQNHQWFSASAIVPRNNRLPSSQPIEAPELWLRKSRGCGGSAPASPVAVGLNRQPRTRAGKNRARRVRHTTVAEAIDETGVGERRPMSEAGRDERAEKPLVTIQCEHMVCCCPRTCERRWTG